MSTIYKMYPMMINCDLKHTIMQASGINRNYSKIIRWEGFLLVNTATHTFLVAHPSSFHLMGLQTSLTAPRPIVTSRCYQPKRCWMLLDVAGMSSEFLGISSATTKKRAFSSHPISRKRHAPHDFPSRQGPLIQSSRLTWQWSILR